MDFLDYYSCMWNTLTVVDPATGTSLRFNNSELCRRFPDWRERDDYLRGRLIVEAGKRAHA
jgi:hypothetical protein